MRVPMRTYAGEGVARHPTVRSGALTGVLWLLFIGLHTTFLVQHWLGVEGMPRHYASYGANRASADNLLDAGYDEGRVENLEKNIENEHSDTRAAAVTPGNERPGMGDEDRAVVRPTVLDECEPGGRELAGLRPGLSGSPVRLGRPC